MYCSFEAKIIYTCPSRMLIMNLQFSSFLFCYNLKRKNAGWNPHPLLQHACNLHILNSAFPIIHVYCTRLSSASHFQSLAEVSAVFVAVVFKASMCLGTTLWLWIWSDVLFVLNCQLSLFLIPSCLVCGIYLDINLQILARNFHSLRKALSHGEASAILFLVHKY